MTAPRSARRLASVGLLALVAACGGGAGDTGGITTTTAAALPTIDPACDADVLHRTTCDFVLAVTGDDLDGLTATEREVATEVTDLPDGPWALDGCELVGDVTVECRVAFPTGETASEGTVATFGLQPSNGTYVPETGGIEVAPGQELDYEVIAYEGLGP